MTQGSPQQTDAAAESGSEPLPPREKVKTFPTTPGVYLMKDAQGPGDLRRQGGQPPQPRVQLLHQCRRRRPAHRRPGPGNRRPRLHRDRFRSRCAAARSPPDQGHSAPVQFGAQGRQDLPVPADRHRRGLSPGRVHPQAAGKGGEALRSVHVRQAASRDDRGAAKDLPLSHLYPRYRRGRRTLAVVPPLPARQHQAVYGPLQPPHFEGRVPAKTSDGCGCFSTAERSAC